MRYNVLTWLEEAEQTRADAIAVIEEARRISWTALAGAARRVGTALIARGWARRPVAVFMEKGIDALTVFLGALYAGGYYSLFNPQLPAVRLTAMKAALEPALIVTDAALREQAETVFDGTPVLSVEELSGTAEDARALLQVRDRAIDLDPVYVNFTSGSTGTPKGIAVAHRSILDFIDVFVERFGIDEGDVIANQAPFDFDVSVKDIYSALKTGATLLIVPRRLFSMPAALIDYLCENGATTLIWAVSALCLMTAFHALDYRVPEGVRRVIFSGEVMPAKHLAQWRAHLPGAMFVNVYGPTEITCNCTYHILDPGRDYAQGVPIGVPFPNEDVFLLDDQDCRVEALGEAGEICVRGTALALGYVRAPEMTAKHFTLNPLETAWPERIYRTGDLGMYGEDGELYFKGRKDFQIKYQGHRIELEEIEQAMSGLDGVERCCCLFDEKRARLKGFYMGSVEESELRARLMTDLPAYMVPVVLRRLEAMPLTKNGKIDRAQLAEMK